MITTEFIFMAAVIVFLLLVIGSILSVREFEQLIEESDAREKRRVETQQMRYATRPIRRN